MTSPSLLVEMDDSKEDVSDMAASELLENSPKPDTIQETKPIKEDASHIVPTYNGVLDELDSDCLQESPSPNTLFHEPQSNQGKNICLASLRIDSSHIVTTQNCLSDVVPSDGLKKIQSTLVVPVTPVKALDDGYHWRKYGQKNVRGNEFIRSYYKCTHPTCQVKKQVERSHVGQITDTLYFGKHDHPMVQPISLPEAEPISVSLSSDSFNQEGFNIIAEPEPVSEPDPSFVREEKALENPKPPTVFGNGIDMGYGESGSDRIGKKACDDESQEPKRRKQDCYDVESSQSDEQIGEFCLVGGLIDTDKTDKQRRDSRIVVRTTSDVDIVNDGYRWRKYGQKLVKGNPNPRSYYRCSNVGCPVKKHVEREQEDPKVVITAYEGKHEHSMPMATRIVTPNSNPTSLNKKLPRVGSAEENAVTGHEVIVQYSLETESGNEEPVHTL